MCVYIVSIYCIPLTIPSEHMFARGPNAFKFIPVSELVDCVVDDAFLRCVYGVG
jgi:hypothetical protein